MQNIKQILKPNPTMIKLADDRKYIVFTAMKRQARSSGEIDDENDQSNEIRPIHYPTIFFHSLEQNAIVWEIFGGEIFIDVVPNEDPEKPFDVYYLTNEIWQEVDE